MVGNIRIPKRIGAVKISKKVRKKARKAIESATSPFVRDFATAAMAAAGRARRAGQDNDGNGREADIMCGETRVHIEGSKVAEAFRAAAVDGFRRFLEGFEEGLRKAQAGDAPAAAPAPAAKPAAKPKAAKPKAKAAKAKAAKPRARKPSSGSAKPSPRAPAA